MLALSACFDESEPNADGNSTEEPTGDSGPAMDDGVGTTTSEDTTGAPDSSGSSSEESTDGDTTGCGAGEPGCPCDAGGCVDGHACAAGICEPIPETCGNGMLDLAEGETCDDSNTNAADGCSPLCQWERHCFVEHLGGTPTVGVRAFGLVPDGTLTMGGQIDVPGTHEPLPPDDAIFAGSLLNGAATRCRNLAYMAFEGSGSIAGIGMNDLDPVVVVDPVELSVIGVRELACDPIAGRLFAVRVEGMDVAVRSIELEPDGSFGATDEWNYPGVSTLGARSARITLDPVAQRVFLLFVDDGSAQVPVESATLSYDGPLTEVAGLDLSLTLNNTVHGIGFSIEPPAIVATGRRASQPSASARFDLDEDGLWIDGETFTDAPWSSRHNHLRLRLPGGPSGFALGGEDGVLIARFDLDGAMEQVGATVAAEAQRTFARAAFADRVLLVASTTGLQTYDLTMEPNDGQWPLLSEIQVGAPATFESGAMIPCPG